MHGSGLGNWWIVLWLSRFDPSKTVYRLGSCTKSSFSVLGFTLCPTWVQQISPKPATIDHMACDEPPAAGAHRECTELFFNTKSLAEVKMVTSLGSRVSAGVSLAQVNLHCSNSYRSWFPMSGFGELTCVFVHRR